MMKRFCQMVLVITALFWSAYGCSDEMRKPDPSVFLDCSVISETEIEFAFSTPVKVLSLSFYPALDISLIEDGSTVKVHLEKSFKPGVEFSAELRAEDEWGNAINVQASFEREADSLLFLGCTVISEVEIEFAFSIPVRLASLSIEPELDVALIEEGSTVKVLLEKSFKPGVAFTAKLFAEDEWGYTVSVQTTFEREKIPIELLACNVISDTEIDFAFSLPVKLTSLSFEPELDVTLIGEGSTVKVLLKKGFKPGVAFTAKLLAEDEWGYTVSVQTTFEREKIPIELLACNVISDTEIDFAFSLPVKLTSLSFKPELDAALIGEGSTVKVLLKKSFKPGVAFVADIVAEDEWGYTISVQTTFEREMIPIEFLACNVVSQTEIEYEFSIPVKMVSLSFNPPLGINTFKDGSTVKVHLTNNFKQGIRYTANILVEDEWGYTYNDIIPFETDPPPLEFLASSIATPTIIHFEFSAPVKMQILFFEPSLGVSFIEEGRTVKVHLKENLKMGQKFTIVFRAEDEFGQTVNGSVPFFILNNQVPELLINELRTEYSGSAYRAEYIEFKILSAGNLGALRVFAASNSRDPLIYEFQSVEVKAGDYVVLHLRTLEDSCVDEYGNNLSESGGRDASPTARDFWIPGSTKLLRKTDAVYVMDQNDRVLDAVMIAENPDASWRDNLAEAAEFLFNKGAWKSSAGGVCSPMNAVHSAAIGTAATRSINRDETVNDSNTAADWYVAVTGGATPGLPNDPRRF